MASATRSPAHAPSPVASGAGRAADLPRDPGRATELLYKRHGATVFRYAWHLLGRREDAEDASQATFLAVHRALATGTAVLEPGAWVLRIARNECLSRLRQRARVPGSSAFDGAEARSSGGMERLAEVRNQMRVARDTLRALPVPEREAFVLREWLGLGTAEVAFAMSLTSGEIESLAGRARRSLVLAVGGLEPAVGCADTRTALEAGSLGRAGTVHLLRCPMCRGVRRALRPPEATGVPGAIVGERLAGALPGFASGGGGIVAVLTTKAAAAPLLAKTAALAAAALVTVGVTQHAIQRVAAPSHHAAAVVRARGGEAHALVLATAVTTTIARSSLTPVASAKTAHTQAVDLRAPAKPSHVRGGVAHSTTSRSAFTGHRDGARSSDDGSDGSRRGAISSGGSGDTGRHENETTTASTHTSGSEDGSTTSHRSSETQTSDGETSGSGRDGSSTTSEGSGDGGSTSVSGGTGTIAAPVAPTDGSDGSSPSGGSDATTSGDAGAGAPATAVTTTVATTTDPSLTQPTSDG